MHEKVFHVDTFLAACDREMRFLSTDYGFSEVERQVQPLFLTVSYGNRKTGIKVLWEYGEEVLIGIYSLADDQMFYLGSLIEMRVTEEMPPCRTRPWIKVEDAISSLAEQAFLLRTYAEDALRGDSRVMAAVQEFRSHPWILKTIPGIMSQGYEDVRPGCIFAIEPSEGRYIYGRVMSMDAQVGKYRDLLLYYVYRAESDDLKCVPPLRREDLLVPPIITGSLSRGTFRIVEQRDIVLDDLLPQHCFRDSKGIYHDEHNNILPAATEPCGIYSAASTKRINDLIAVAMGINSPSPMQ